MKTYKTLSINEANALMDKAEKLGMDYDIWNAEDMFCGVCDEIEIGFEEKDWLILTTE